MKKELNVTENGFEVYSIVNDSHMEAHASVKETDIAEAISKITLTPPFGMYTVDLVRICGVDNCVLTMDSDDIRWENRPGRNTPSRMVYGREPEPTSLITIGICTDDDGKETIFTAFYGALAPKELTDPRLKESERGEAEKFWSCHALVAEEGR